MDSSALGIDAYDGSHENNGELLKNLEGCTVHRFSPGTGEHAGTALMIVELETGDGLGIQIEMDTINDRIPVQPCTRNEDGELVGEGLRDYREHAVLEPDDGSLEICEVAHSNIMDEEEARVLVLLEGDDGEPFAVDVYLDETGGTEFFEVEL